MGLLPRDFKSLDLGGEPTASEGEQSTGVFQRRRVVAASVTLTATPEPPVTDCNRGGKMAWCATHIVITPPAPLGTRG